MTRANAGRLRAVDDEAVAALLSERLRKGHALQQSPRRVYSLLRSAIRTGELPAHTRLDEADLVVELKTSRNAVRLALQQLDADGLVDRRPGLGTVVVSQIQSFPVFECVGPAIGVTGALLLLENQRIPPTPYLSSRIGGGSEPLHMSEFLVRVGGQTVGVFSRYGHERAEALEQDRPFLKPGDLSWYRRIHGSAPGDIRVVIEATGADARTARLLGVEEGSPLLVRETLYFDQNHDPVELHSTYLDSRRASLLAVVTDGELQHDAVAQVIPPR
ncbi:MULTISPECIES: GntR family transcriptional regulator [Herbiconiux]|jgi:GntR family transcriptional regulator|uniref:GntR family transcriptional regulator n=1 Tax=Herbiconiux flava TaxID=881268 RepID=A0A852SI05_9MICO|nr:MULTISPECIES: GntR family transcriptional regulator [Herbiconiux]MBF4572968.1 GntR family transcriptional regulator [Herbiconiux sp. VKM Ac-1786]NYD68850.1 GntR family transcriptional regulator [Herbiconiux flava]